MLQLSAALLNKPILSLRTGSPIGTALSPIFNPNNLKIEGFYSQDRFEKSQLILLSQDIREILPDGFVVDDHEVLTDPEELVRLKSLLELRFELIGKPVVTIDKERLGKVNDFAVDNASLYVQKIYVSRSLLKSLSTGQLSIDRTNIVEITDRKIVIQEILKPVKNPLAATSPIA